MAATSSPFESASSSPQAFRKKSASPFKTERYSPYKLPRKTKSLLHLNGHPHSHPNPTPPTYSLPVTSDAKSFTHEGETFIPTRHIILDFTLFKDGIQHSPSEAQVDVIMDLFPTSYKLSFALPFLIVVCKTLPAKPWPVSVAGLPLFLTTDPDASPMDYGQSSHGPKQTIKNVIDLDKMPGTDVINSLFQMFDSLNAKIHRIQWVAWGFLAIAKEEPYTDWKRRLPGMINKIRIGYIFGEQSIDEKALRRKVPFGRVRDDESYSDLRPGVMVASKVNQNEEILTTSGICVQSPSGNKYITVASHGFRAGVEGIVMHPTCYGKANGKAIAKVAKVFGLSDISLAELNNVHYSRTTFATSDAPVEPFNKLGDIEEVRLGDPIFMDTPFNGRCEGMVMKMDWLRIPTDEPADNTHYIIGAFLYFGNGGDTLFEGCCGGVIWNTNHDVLGQFRFQETGSGKLCYCPSFKRLQQLGYTVAEA